MTTFNFYFSFATGSDTTGDGSEGSPWKTHTKMGSIVASKASGDVVNLFLKRGDTWQINTVSSTLYHILFPSTGPEVNVNAYGGLATRPIIDGMVTNWSSVPYDGAGGVWRYNRVFSIERSGCSIKNIEIRNVYGHGIALKNVDYCIFSGCYIHNFGSCAIATLYGMGGDYHTVAYNIFHTGQQLFKYAKRTGWEAAVNLISRHADGSPIKGNHVHHNIVYDIFGEGLNVPNSVIEWNLVGDTGSVKLNTAPHDYDSLTSVIRYNLALQSSSNAYRISGQAPTALRVFDEKEGGNNSQANYQYYGNVTINTETSLWVHANAEFDNPWNKLLYYNNLSIDPISRSYVVFYPELFGQANIYNNSSLLIKRTDGQHANIGGGEIPSLPHPNWNITGNHYWTKGAATPTVPSAWRGSWNTVNPQLLGQDTVNWTGLTGVNYWKSVNPVLHLNPPLGSPIYGLNPLLTMDINAFVETIEDYHLTGQGETDPVEIIYSISPFGTGDLKTGSPTITIVDGFATLSVAQTGNLGAGDRITYDTDKIGYIYRIYSQTELDIRTATGGIPADITDSTVVSIKHEYASVAAAIAGAKDASHLNTTDLVTGKIKLKLAGYYDHDDGTAELNAFTFSGYTQSEDYQIELFAPTGIPYSFNRQAHLGQVKETPDYFWCSGDDLSFVTNSIPHTIINGIDFHSDADANGSFIQFTEKLTIKNSMIRNEQLSVASIYGLWVRNLSTSTVPGMSLESVMISGFIGNVLFAISSIATQNMVNDFNCVTLYAEQIGTRAVVVGIGSNTPTINFNIFNSLFFADTGTLYDWGTYAGIWNIHDSIFSDTLYTSRDSAAYGCLPSRTATDNSSPGAGNFVIFEDITSDIKDLRLARSADNDAYNMHSNSSGAGLTVPAKDISETSRPQENDYDCGPFELVQNVSPVCSIEDITTTFTLVNNINIYFTGIDYDSDDIIYHIQIDTIDSFDSVDLIEKYSATDAGFLDVENELLLSPFESGRQIVYSQEIAEGIYYCRVRGKDLLGTNTWGEWSTSFIFLPTTVPPTTLLPTTLAPTTVSPTTLLPTTLATTLAPTTLAPTSLSLTTLSPTTLAPTTLPPTTLTPTTIAPTTLAPTTSVPTTLATTTSAPTTLAPTTVTPTTVSPTTLSPTTIVTTLPPTTLLLTTLQPTTLLPTTLPPTTLAPTTLAPVVVTATLYIRSVISDDVSLKSTIRNING